MKPDPAKFYVYTCVNFGYPKMKGGDALADVDLDGRVYSHYGFAGLLIESFDTWDGATEALYGLRHAWGVMNS